MGGSPNTLGKKVLISLFFGLVLLMLGCDAVGCVGQWERCLGRLLGVHLVSEARMAGLTGGQPRATHLI